MYIVAPVYEFIFIAYGLSFCMCCVCKSFNTETTFLLTYLLTYLLQLFIQKVMFTFYAVVRNTLVYD